MRALPPLVLTVLMAFIPKCPACFVAYLSLFGSAGLALTPYTEWLYPLLVVFLLLHLTFLFPRTTHARYAPFVLSGIGSIAIVVARFFLSEPRPAISIAGVSLVFLGSLWNGFSKRPLTNPCCSNNHRL